MVFEPTDITHKCSVCDYCLLNDNYKILFCIFCRKVIGYEKEGRRYIINQTQFKQKEYSPETLNDSV